MTEQRIVLETAVLLAADTPTPLTTFFGLGDPPLVAPADTTRLKGIRVAFAGDGTALGAAVIALELVGTGLAGSPHRFIIGGYGGEIVTSNAMPLEPHMIDTDIKSIATQAFTATLYCNIAVGNLSVGIELIWE